MSLLELPADIETHLDALAKVKGYSKSYHACQAILDYLDDVDDLRLAEQEMEEVGAGRSVPLTLDVVMKHHGLAV